LREHADNLGARYLSAIESLRKVVTELSGCGQYLGRGPERVDLPAFNFLPSLAKVEKQAIWPEPAFNVLAVDHGASEPWRKLAREWVGHE
jgi:hypothetical protein